MGQRKNLRIAIDNPYVDAAAESTHFVPRGIWSVLGLAMLALSILCTVELLKDYLSYPSYTEISSEFVEHYHLPAITICNINRLNRTQMEEDTLEIIMNKKTETVSVYSLYKKLGEQYKDRSRSKGGENVPFEKIDILDINRRYGWNIAKNLKYQFLTFAKGKLQGNKKGDYYKEEYTEMGNCLEINDKQVLIQRVNGPVGGLSMILDTETEHYLDSTDSEGFYVVLRMPNETVINKEYAFRVSPGSEVYIQLQTTEVARLGPPYGNCQDDEDIFKTTDNTRGRRDTLSVKECYTNQILWLYMKERLCKCYPWYIFSRYIQMRTGTSKNERNTRLEDQLMQFYSSGIREDKRLNLNNDTTCYYTDQYSYTGTPLTTQQGIAAPRGCEKECRGVAGCTLFMWTDPRTESSTAVGGECVLFDGTALLSDELSYKVTRGETNCTRVLTECTISKETICENIVIDVLMSNDTARQPLKCQEPCSYNKTSYTLSSSSFPSRRLWDKTLESSFPQYKTFAEAKRNLVKLVFFQEVLTRVTENQVAAYNWRSFVGELGGAVDLFIGISVMTLLKFIEWLLCYVSGCRRAKKGVEDDTGYEMDEGVKSNSLATVST